MVKKDDAAPILSLDFDSRPSVYRPGQKATAHHRALQRTGGLPLRQLYDALYAKAHVQCAWPSFQNTYYRVRKEDDVQIPEEEPKPLPPASAPQVFSIKVSALAAIFQWWT